MDSRGDMMRRTVLLVFLMSVILLISGGNQAFSQEENTRLVWKGCGISRKAFMAECAQAYEEKTGTHIELIGGGATLGIRATLAGDADIGGTCRPSLPNIFPNQESGGYLTQVAWDAICFITHPGNPVNGITIQQARDILTGKINNWRQVGGPDHPIVVIYRIQTEIGKFSGVGYMTRRFLFDDPYVEFTEKALYFRDSGLVEKNVENIPWAFAPDGVSSARRRNVKILALDGVPCTKENVAKGIYPFFRPLYLITRGKPTGELKKFLDWIISDEGQAVISAVGTVTLKEGQVLKEKFKFWEHTESILNFE